MVQMDFEATFAIFLQRWRRDHLFCFEEIAAIVGAMEEFGYIGLIEVTMKQDTVAFCNLSPRVGDLVGEIAVVGNNEESFTVLVESPGTKQTLSLQVGWEEVEDGVFGMWIRVGAEISLRLVHGQCDRAMLFFLERLVLYEDRFRFGRKGFVSKLGHLPIDAHIPVFNEMLCLATGAKASTGNQFLYALFLNFGHLCTLSPFLRFLSMLLENELALLENYTQVRCNSRNHGLLSKSNQ